MRKDETMNPAARQIVDTFEEHVRRAGYDGANLDDVARELRISKKTIYAHFESKRALYGHVVARQALHEKARLSSATQALPDYTSKVEAVVRSVVEMGRAHVRQTGQQEWLHEYAIAADAFREATGELLRELAQGGMDSGEFSSGDPALVEKMVAAMIVEYLMIVNTDPEYDRDDELVARIVKFAS